MEVAYAQFYQWEILGKTTTRLGIRTPHNGAIYLGGKVSDPPDQKTTSRALAEALQILEDVGAPLMNEVRTNGSHPFRGHEIEKILRDKGIRLNHRACIG